MSDVVSLVAGATEAQIQSALDNLPDGGRLVLAANQVVSISNGLVVDVSSRSISFDLNGSTLQQAGDVSVLMVRGSHAPGQGAVLGRDGGGQVTVTSSGPAAAASVGDWVKIYSDSVLPNDHGAWTRLGQAMEVVAVDGNQLTLKGELVDEALYVQNIRVSKYQSGEAVVANGTVRGDQANPDWLKDLVQLRSTVDAQIDHLVVRDGNSMGINAVDSVHATISQSAAINLTDDTVNGHFGYGVHSASSWGTTVEGFYAEKVRHATDNNAVGTGANTLDPSKYGADLGLTVSDVVAFGTTAFAFSWHSEGRKGSVADSVVFDSYGVLGARGLHNSMSDVAGSGNARGIQFYEYGDGDGRHISIDNVQLRVHGLYGYTTIGATADNQITNSTFETFDKKIWTATGVTTIDTITRLLPWGSQAAPMSLAGTAADDRLTGGKGADTLDGGAAGDYIHGGVGADLLTGGAGADRFAYLSAAEGGDTITDFEAGIGGDKLDLSVMAIRNGWRGDVFSGGYVSLLQAGTDTLVQVDANGGGDSYVTLATLQNANADTVRWAVTTAIHVTGPVAPEPQPQPVPAPALPPPVTEPVSLVDTYPNALLLTVNGTLEGTSGADVLIGTALDDKLIGGDGDDTLVGGGGRDALAGGLGRNVASYEQSSAGLTVDLQTASLNTGEAAGDSYSGVAAIFGSTFDDELFGNGSANTIEGRAGADLIDGRAGADWLHGDAGGDTLSGGSESDKLFGGDGDDRLVGGTGYDQMTGGAGADGFVLEWGDVWDVIADFTTAEDHIVLMGFGSSIGFVASATPLATTAVGTILYDTDDGTLSWDADGIGAARSVKIATLTGAPELVVSDFLFG